MIATAYENDVSSPVSWNESALEAGQAEAGQTIEPLECAAQDLIWDDAGLMEIARRDTEERNLILGQLMEMTLSSAGGYQEVLEFGHDEHLESFAAVIIRQRMAMYRALAERRTQIWSDEPGQSKEMLSAIRSAWRLAIWNLEQNQPSEFIDRAERAESLLEDAFLAASAAFDDRAWQEFLQDCAVMICGARSVWEEMGDEFHRLPLDAEGGIYELAIE